MKHAYGKQPVYRTKKEQRDELGATCGITEQPEKRLEIDGTRLVGNNVKARRRLIRGTDRDKNIA